jgi:hypothetical protein
MTLVVKPLPPSVAPLISALVDGAREALGENLLGVYLRGSLAIGDFDPETSDVDALIVTHNRVSDAEFEALRQMHERLRGLPNRYAAGLEAAYIDAESAKRFVPGERQPTITSHDPFRWERLDSNWVLDLWMARERSPALYGPDPRAVFGAISEAELRDASARRLREWDGWAADVPEQDRVWLNDCAHQAYIVETACRALYTMESGELPTKPQAVAWALGVLPEPWRGLVEWSQEHRADGAEDGAKIPDVQRFLRWAVSEWGGGLGRTRA